MDWEGGLDGYLKDGRRKLNLDLVYSFVTNLFIINSLSPQNKHNTITRYSTSLEPYDDTNELECNGVTEHQSGGRRKAVYFFYIITTNDKWEWEILHGRQKRRFFDFF